jgi:hypothetical protein
MEFKRDEQEALNLAMGLLIEHPWFSPRSWPTHGMLSSNGVANAPLFTWIIAAIWAPTRDPVAVARFVALINALCLYPLWLWARRHMDEYRALLTLAICAVSPFAVIFSRKIWAQDLLLPGVLAVLWGVEWLRSDKPWRGVVLLLVAALVAGQLHQSGPIALALLPLAIGAQFLIDRRRGHPGIRFTRPSTLEWAALIVVVGLNLFFWLPYLAYFFRLPGETFANRPRLDVIRPHLLGRVAKQVVPLDLFYFFKPDRADFLQDALRSSFYHVSVALGAPLLVYGVWRWLRSPLSIPVLGLWWAGIIAVFALLRIPTYPFYALILAPLPALLAAGAFDDPLMRGWLVRLLAGWRLAYVIALLGLTIATGAWLAGRGGVAGDYGIAYAIREAQARSIVIQLNSRPPEHYYDLGELRPSEKNKTLTCGPPPIEVEWIVRSLDPSHPGVPPRFLICDGWLEEDGSLVYRWRLRVTE